MNKIKLLSLFTGIGAFEKALKKLDIDYELVNFCEIDPFAIKSYFMIHDVLSDKNYENLRIRKLTPNESWRLMGFTDLDFKKCKDGGISDAQLYKQAGNSIVVNVLEAILDRLLKNKAETLMDWLN
jgi:site-specific DNA-cytosine methylase